MFIVLFTLFTGALAYQEADLRGPFEKPTGVDRCFGNLTQTCQRAVGHTCQGTPGELRCINAASGLECGRERAATPSPSLFLLDVLCPTGHAIGQSCSCPTECLIGGKLQACVGVSATVDEADAALGCSVPADGVCATDGETCVVAGAQAQACNMTEQYASFGGPAFRCVPGAACRCASSLADASDPSRLRPCPPPATDGMTQCALGSYECKPSDVVGTCDAALACRVPSFELGTLFGPVCRGYDRCTRFGEPCLCGPMSCAQRTVLSESDRWTDDRERIEAIGLCFGACDTRLVCPAYPEQACWRNLPTETGCGCYVAQQRWVRCELPSPPPTWKPTSMPPPPTPQPTRNVNECPLESVCPSNRTAPPGACDAVGAGGDGVCVDGTRCVIDGDVCETRCSMDQPCRCECACATASDTFVPCEEPPCADLVCPRDASDTCEVYESGGECGAGGLCFLRNTNAACVNETACGAAGSEGDACGCSCFCGTDYVLDEAVDSTTTCGKDGKKALICGKNGKTRCIARSAVKDDDVLGACPEPPALEPLYRCRSPSDASDDGECATDADCRGSGEQVCYDGTCIKRRDFPWSTAAATDDGASLVNADGTLNVGGVIVYVAVSLCVLVLLLAVVICFLVRRKTVPPQVIVVQPAAAAAHSRNASRGTSLRTSLRTSRSRAQPSHLRSSRAAYNPLNPTHGAQTVSTFELPKMDYTRMPPQ